MNFETDDVRFLESLAHPGNSINTYQNGAYCWA